MSAALEHHDLDVNGVRIHAVAEGDGPLVILVHGFPESWYSWRHQLSALAAAGYRAVAYDQRGYGQSSKFGRVEDYRIDKPVADLVGLVSALGEKKAVIVGHDWGAPVVWTAAWMHPEKFRGVMGVSVPFGGRGLIPLPGSPFGEKRPDEHHAEIAGPGQDFYQDYFGAMDKVVQHIEADLRGWLRDVIWSLSGAPLAAAGIDLDTMDPIEVIRNGATCIPHGGNMRDRFMTPERMPPWFTENDLDFFTAEFRRSGFAGPLSFYNQITESWKFLAPMEGKPLEVPAAFFAGEFDVVRGWGLECIARQSEMIPNYLGTQILKGSGHWIQQERPEETNAALIKFLRQLPA